MLHLKNLWKPKKRFLTTFYAFLMNILLDWKFFRWPGREQMLTVTFFMHNFNDRFCGRIMQIFFLSDFCIRFLSNADDWTVIIYFLLCINFLAICLWFFVGFVWIKSGLWGRLVMMILSVKISVTLGWLLAGSFFNFQWFYFYCPQKINFMRGLWNRYICWERMDEETNYK